MITVYFNDIAIRLSDESHHSNKLTNVIRITKRTESGDFLNKLLGGEFTSDVVLLGDVSLDLFHKYPQHIKFIEAAGGVVENDKKELLLIKRFGIWDLPKGKIEKHESEKEAAIREVCEETGLSNVKIINALPDTFHIYQQTGKWYLKKTHWFLMKTEDASELVPQTDEDISEALWMEKNTANNAISHSYRSIKETLGYLFV